MPFVIITIGLILLAASYQGKQDELFTLIKGDLTGTPSYLAWILAIGAIGAVGYIRPLKPISVSFLILVIVVLFLSNGGFFQKFFATAQGA